MNNKGFAITTMLYGTFVIFLMLMMVMLGILNTYKTNMEKLIDGMAGAREITRKSCSDYFDDTNKNGKWDDADTLKDDSLDSYKTKILNLCK